MTAAAAAMVRPPVPAVHDTSDVRPRGDGSFAAMLGTHGATPPAATSEPVRTSARTAPVEPSPPKEPPAGPVTASGSVPVPAVSRLSPVLPGERPAPAAARPASDRAERPARPSTEAARTALPHASDGTPTPDRPAPLPAAAPLATAVLVVAPVASAAAAPNPADPEEEPAERSDDDVADPETASPQADDGDPQPLAVAALAPPAQPDGPVKTGLPAPAAPAAVTSPVPPAGMGGTVLAPGQAATSPGDAPAASGRPGGQPATPAAPVDPAPAAQVISLLRAAGTAAGQTFTMQLRPERLGTVEVRLEIDAKGRAVASFQADRPETLQLLQHDMHHLVRTLNEAGLDADASSLSFGLRDSGAGSDSNGRQTASPRTAFAGGPKAAAAADEAVAYRPASSTRLYDIHA